MQHSERDKGNPMTTLHLLAGIQGSGKSTFSQQLREKTGAIVLGPDDFRTVITGKEYNKLAEGIVWAHVKTAMYVFLRRGDSVILDATSINKYFRSEWIKLGKDEGVPVNCHYLLTPLDVALKRNAIRPTQRIPEEAIRRYVSKFEFPSIKEGFENIYIYNQTLDLIGWAAKNVIPEHYTEVYKLFAGTNPYRSPDLVEKMQQQQEKGEPLSWT